MTERRSTLTALPTNRQAPDMSSFNKVATLATVTGAAFGADRAAALK
jgi:hypothetical protein